MFFSATYYYCILSIYVTVSAREINTALLHGQRWKRPKKKHAEEETIGELAELVTWFSLMRLKGCPSVVELW